MLFKIIPLSIMVRRHYASAARIIVCADDRRPECRFKRRVRQPRRQTEGLKDVEEAARVHTRAAVATLARIAADTNAPPAAQVSAATALLDRAYGRPRKAVEASGKMAVTLEQPIGQSYAPPLPNTTE
ncbi:MAG TPA: hypothetical protein VHS58_23680 [Acetobacteraceae bacterium]|nr:hypothetical protein [Acetobacteraceae bacterium]